MTLLKCIALLVSVILVASVAAHGGHHRHHHHDHDEGADHHEHHKCSHSHSSHDHHHHDNEVHEDHDTHSLSDESHSHSHSHPAVVTSHDDRSSPLASALIDGTIGSLFTSVVPIAVIPIVALVSGPGIGGGAQRAHTRLVVLTSIAAGAIIADSLSHYPSSAGEEGHHHHDHDHDHHTGSGHTSGGGVKEVFGLALSAWYVLGFVSFFVVDGCSFGAGGCHDHSDGPVIALKFVWANNFGVETSDQLLEALEAFVGGSFLYLGTVVLIADLNRQLATRSILLKAVAAVAFYGGVQALEVAHLLESAFV
ncbi:membrane-associated protein, putative [Bodo saltans]|uniref:Membrane-associated protein, putative n=1 Tax=Bodo saltans TaxID=75058 RepID=A0A0S4JV50_BODSA|nr:membrane-associated protein, putative [Bodo saltans]|eukprot:CUG94440.1 membrane-associated protein, putative [Bodo saltans]